MNMTQSKQNYDARSYLILMLKRLKVMKGPTYTLYPFEDLDQGSFHMPIIKKIDCKAF
jgi:hypothetical protein